MSTIIDGSRATDEDVRPRELAVFISIRTILLVGVAVAVAWAVASIGNILLLVFVAVFNTAVLSPVVDAMARRAPWSRGVCATVVVFGIVVLTAAGVAVLVAPVADGVRDFANNLPRLLDEVRHSSVGRSLDSGGHGLTTLQQHAGDIVSGARRVSGGLVHAGVSAFGLLTLVASVTFMTLFLLIDLPRVRAGIGGLIYRERRDRYQQVTDRIIRASSRYMLGNVAISLICAATYGVTAAILGLRYAFALALFAGLLDMIPNVGALIAGAVIGVVALSVSTGAAIVFVIVMLVYQQFENYVLQPTIIGSAVNVSGFTVIVSVLIFGALFGVVGAIIGVPIAAAIQIILEEVTAGRRARIAANDADRHRTRVRA
jgi:predicted PurR-regulated permease PerM